MSMITRRSILGMFAVIPFVKIPPAKPVKVAAPVRFPLTESEIVALELERVNQNISQLFDRECAFLEGIR